MIDMPHFDTLQYVETLKTAGVPENQAKAFAKAQQTVISECLETTMPNKLATKADLTNVRTELKADIADVRTELKAVKTELKADIAEIKVELKEVKANIVDLKADNRLFKWMFGFLLSGVGTLVLKSFF
jgi:adenosyl cobinamide kinase/adenosyl cobinamide phosphate guanylyltransferase